MLPEIFQQIVNELLEDLRAKGLKLKKSQVNCGSAKDSRIRIELIKFGSDIHQKNYQPAGPGGKAFYSFTFFIISEHRDYLESLKLTEAVCDHFEKKPFVLVKQSETEFELAISILELSLDEINRFWIAQQQPHQPVIFFQARVAEI